MRFLGVAPRAIALSLSLALGLPDPAFALRVQAGLESASEPDLKASLLEGTSAGLEELPDEMKHWIEILSRPRESNRYDREDALRKLLEMAEKAFSPEDKRWDELLPILIRVFREDPYYQVR